MRSAGWGVSARAGSDSDVATRDRAQASPRMMRSILEFLQWSPRALRALGGRSIRHARPAEQRLFRRPETDADRSGALAKTCGAGRQKISRLRRFKVDP